MKTTKLVKIPLTLTITVIADDESGSPGDAVFLNAAEALVSVEFLAVSHTRSVTNGKTKMLFDLGSLQLAGEPTVVG